MSDGKASMGLKRRTGSIEEQDMEEAYLDELSDDEPSISSAEPKTDAHSAPDSDLTETAPHAEHQSHEGPEESAEVDMLLPDPPEDLSSAVMDTPRVPSENTPLIVLLLLPPLAIQQINPSNLLKMFPQMVFSLRTHKKTRISLLGLLECHGHLPQSHKK